MPYRVNGCGTWYYGKTNALATRDVCPHCHRITTTMSYDTRLYFTLFMLPVIPLSRRRILFECPACTKHHVMKQSVWNAGRDKARDESLATLTENPASVEAAEQALASSLAWQDRETFDDAAPIVWEHHEQNAAVLRALGRGYKFFEELEAAEEALTASLELEDHPDTRLMLALVKMNRDKPDEARQLLQPFLNEHKSEGVGHLYFLALSYMAEGRHDDALSVIVETQQVFPDQQNDAAWKRLRRQAEKNAGTNKPIPTPGLTGPIAPPKETRAGWAAYSGPIIAVLLAVGFTFWSLWTAQHQEVYVVNGLDRAYTIQLDGQPVKLPKLHYTTIELAEGEHTVAAPELGIGPDTFTLRGGFFSRPFSSDVHVLNPDRIALVVHETTQYAEDEELLDEENFHDTLYTNLLAFDTPKVNFYFTEFPDEIETSASSAIRHRIFLVKDAQPEFLWGLLGTRLEPDAMAAYAVQRSRFYPEDEVTYRVMASLMPVEEFRAAVEERLAQRPLLVAAHRAYQEAVGSVEPGYDLEPEYQKILAEDPGATAAKYLLSRVLDDQEAAETLAREAADAQDAPVEAVSGMAYRLMVQGRFEDALPYARQAAELRPAERQLTLLHRQILAGAGRWEEVLGTIPDATLVMADPDAAKMQAAAHFALGDPEQARKTLQNALAPWQAANEPSEEELAATQDYIDMTVAYATGDMDTWATIAGRTDDPSVALVKALSVGTPEEAAEAIAAVPDASAEHHLLLYVVARRAGQTDLAEEHYQIAVDMLREGGGDDQEWAGVLGGSASPDSAGTLRMMSTLEQKPVLLAALGTRFPEDREEYFNLGRRLAFMPTFPSRLLQDIFTEGEATAETSPSETVPEAQPDAPAE